MNQQMTLNGANAQLPDALDLLQQRAIVPEGDAYSFSQLTRELNRRGWRWSVDGNFVFAQKAFPPLGVVAQTLEVYGPDQITNLILVLADVIRYDEDRGLSPWKLYRADVIVRSQGGKVAALVEVKNRLARSSEGATAFRRDLMADNRLDVSVPFFLIVSQEAGFLWDNRKASSPLAEPTKQFPLEGVVAHYWPRFDPHEPLSSFALELVMTKWFDDLALVRPERPLDADQFFEGTDFLDTIRGAVIEEVARD